MVVSCNLILKYLGVAIGQVLDCLLLSLKKVEGALEILVPIQVWGES